MRGAHTTASNGLDGAGRWERASWTSLRPPLAPGPTASRVPQLFSAPGPALGPARARGQPRGSLPAGGPAPSVLCPGTASPPPSGPRGWARGRLSWAAAVTGRSWPGSSSGDPPTAAAARTLSRAGGGADRVSAGGPQGCWPSQPGPWFAAKLIEGVLDFKAMVDNETLPVEYLGGKPLCMNQYYQILSSCRVPGPKQDSVINFSKTKKPPMHITVVHNYQFFELDVYHSDGTPLTSDQIFTQLEKIWNSSLQTNKEPVGILTSNHRNSWAKAYNTLIKDKVNRDSVRSIQKSIFTVCLDAPVPRVSEDVYRSRVAGQMLHGGGSKINSGNRWFDKTLQFIVAEDGSCGLVYEHAAAEGPPIIALVDHVIEFTKKPELVRSPMVPLPMPKKLRFNITPEIKSDIEKAKQNLSIMIQDLDLTVMMFHHFGKDFPKSEKLSPDAFIQMALQLAYYRIYGQACATYESASLRMFHLGRTDTIRSASTDSLTFVKAMDDSNVAGQQKVELLRKAVQAHRAYTDRAIRGEAFDRHLLGLKLQAIEDLVSMPDIFMDTSYAIAMHFNLSTSQVPAKTDCVMFFGPVVPDGYGVCYNPMEAHINFSVSAYNSCAETNAVRLAHYLENALLDMRALLQSHPRAKL
uniref:Carnitine O-acetyltransferase n=1 Tax=Equus caballus TaxID=9796 RepID=A0A3Q2I4W3_HORSE